MAGYQVLYWHDIPLQVRARGEGGRSSVQLPSRFQEAADSAAMASKQIDSDNYTAGLHWSDWQERVGSAQDVTAAVAAEIEAQYPDIDWRKTAVQLKSRQK